MRAEALDGDNSVRAMRTIGTARRSASPLRTCVVIAPTMVSASPIAASGVRSGAIPNAPGRTNPQRPENLEQTDGAELDIADVPTIVEDFAVLKRPADPNAR